MQLLHGTQSTQDKKKASSDAAAFTLARVRTQRKAKGGSTDWKSACRAAALKKRGAGAGRAVEVKPQHALAAL
jgi:hypothetical protein